MVIELRRVYSCNNCRVEWMIEPELSYPRKEDFDGNIPLIIERVRLQHYNDDPVRCPLCGSETVEVLD